MNNSLFAKVNWKNVILNTTVFSTNLTALIIVTLQPTW